MKKREFDAGTEPGTEPGAEPMTFHERRRMRRSDLERRSRKERRQLRAQEPR